MATRNLTESFANMRAKNSRGPSEPRTRSASGGTRGLLEDIPLSTREAAVNPLGEVRKGWKTDEKPFSFGWALVGSLLTTES
jgi:hypothetical protein